MNKTRKRSARELDVKTSDDIYHQGTGLSATNGESLDHLGVKREKIKKDGYNENSSAGSNDCSYDQDTGIISIAEGECDDEVDVGSNDYLDHQVAGLPNNKSDHLHQKNTETNFARVLYMEVNGDGGCKENRVFGSVDCLTDQNTEVSSTKGQELCQSSTESSDLRIPVIRPEIFSDECVRGAIKLEKESISTVVHSADVEQLGGEEDEDNEDDDYYNRFYFESDHLALKDNKHYHLLLQSLLVLESQRSQAVKDLDVLYKEQAQALQDPISFVEKLQNNEPLNLPTHHKVVKLPFIPWEEYTVSLNTLDRQRLSNPHHTRAATSQNLGKVSDSVTNASDGNENAPVPSESNVYSVFGGEFVASKHGKPLGRESLTSVFTTRTGDATSGKVVRGRSCDVQKPVTFNQPWTAEEQAKLEKLLQIYPQEEVESKRWEKIAAALGNRTLKQVASRVQKYFIKLAKSGLPVPGRMPNLPRTGVRSKRSSHHYQALGFRNSTFFPSYRPKVLMDDEDDTSSVATDDAGGYLSDEESVPVHLRDTEDYRELMELKRIKRQKIVEYQQTEERVLHNGFMCDGCGINPIPGTRWHCNDCSKDNSVDFCNECVERGNVNIGSHSSEHSLESARKNSSFFVDGDYVGFSEGGTSAGYNYLDPNFLPSAR